MASKLDKVDMKLLERLCKAGLTDEQISEILGVTRKTFHDWRVKNKKKLYTIKGWKEEADERVEKSLFQRACGYEHDSEEIFCFQGHVIRVPIVKKYAPSEVACIFWLKNRQPDKWRDKQEEKESDDRLNDEVEFVGVPTKEGNGRFKRFYN